MYFRNYTRWLNVMVGVILSLYGELSAWLVPFCFAICFKVSIFAPKYATNLSGGTFLTLRGITKTSGIPIPGVSP
jgi:hypothetical protein